MKGIDYGYSKPSPKKIKELGYDFVCRYLSHSPQKNLTATELKALKDAGLKVAVVWETTTQRPLSGFDGGEQDAQDAVDQIEELRKVTTIPKDIPIYFACDDDFPESKYPVIFEYLKGAGVILGKSRVGVYGSYAVVKAAFDAGLVGYGWQTYAWSHHKWDERAQLRQTNIYGPTIEGVACDTDESMVDNFGAF